MTILPFETFKKLARRGNLIALRTDMPADLETPVSAFLKLAVHEPSAFLLESVEQEERIGRYSFLGFAPSAVLSVRGRHVWLQAGGHRSLVDSRGAVLEVMQKTLASHHLANPEAVPHFAGGFVGFLGYENIQRFERLSLQDKKGWPVEDAVFFLVKDFLLFDHFQKTLSLITLCEGAPRNQRKLKEVYRMATRRIQGMRRKLERTPLKAKLRPLAAPKIPLHAKLARSTFEAQVKRIKAYIRAGDCIQVVLSQPFHLGGVKNDFEVYRRLRSINPSPYMFYFRHGGLRMIGSSPELLVKKTGRSAQVRPIAGTRPRGTSEAEDLKMENSLRRSSKERAEHLMLVDLGRNDLGRVCDFRSIRVSDFARIERYSHVIHLVSSISGRLKRGKDAFDLLRATFPAGTVTGAPKIRAMEIINELEAQKRGPYAGCLGYFSFSGDMDMCIVIRTIFVMGGTAYVQAGAGVVYDSQPAREYRETLNKAGALVQAISGRPGIL